MQITVTRGSVAAGDDVDAPHKVLVDLPERGTAADLLDALLPGYLPSISGGQATWIVRFGDHNEPGRTIAVAAQQWSEPRFVIAANTPLQGSQRVHLEYLTQRNPHVVVQECLAGMHPRRRD